MINKLDISTLSPLDFRVSIINFVIALVLSLLVRYCYKEFGKATSNRDQISYVFPLITLTTYLIILVVKSSLALSLGLVGALSIVRFRTPIKEPETLGYFFLSISIGLGLGADRRLITVTMILGIIAFYILWSLMHRKKQSANLFLNFSLAEGSDTFSLSTLNEMLGKLTKKLDLRRYDNHKGHLQVTYLIDLQSRNDLETITEKLRNQYPDANLTFVDNNNILLG